MSRLEVLKTYKLFIGGQFPRSESGRHFSFKNGSGQVIANLCLASKKDLRNAVTAARSACSSWSSRPAFNRSQILYRIAEMLEGRTEQFISELVLQGMKKSEAQKEVLASIDRLVYYAGWCDKFQQIFSSVNPVAGNYYNFSLPEPMGVVGIMSGEEDSLLALVSQIAPVIAGGNSCVYLASQRFPLSAITFSEVLGTSDLPGGVVNILTGEEDEILPHLSAHMDVDALIYAGANGKNKVSAEQNCAINVKRFFHWPGPWQDEKAQSPYFIADLQEIKTTWHPIENIGSGGAAY